MTVADPPQEMFDLCDERGRLIGRTKARFEVHRDGDWHRAFHCWVVTSAGLGQARGADPGGEACVVLQRRSLHKATWQGLWDVSVGGHYTAGEGVDGGLREIGEELGLTASSEELVRVARRREEVFYPNGLIEREIQDVYFLRRNVRLAELRPEPEEVMEVAVVPARALARLAAGRLSELSAPGGRVGRDGVVEPVEVVIASAGLVPRGGNYYRKVARFAEGLMRGTAAVRRRRRW
ncbi:MAG: mutT/nudix family protein [Chloroflexi bacterium]|nr:mutT/nudix family protein [Chloroflexota bacterium]